MITERQNEHLMNLLMALTYRQTSDELRTSMWAELRFPIVMKTNGQLRRRIDEQLKKN